jgi:hypothetical protein
MKQLTVSLAYTTSRSGRGGPESSLALPVKVLDDEGSVLLEGAASVDIPASFPLPDEVELAFVRLTWPSGHAETQRAVFNEQSQASVVFSDHRLAPNEWSAWAVPKLNPRTPLAKPSGEVDLKLDRFDNVWLRLWKFERDAWHQEPLKPDATYRNGAAWQLDLSLAQRPWLLQVGGSKVTWRFVSLPGGGPARVLITPKDSSDPRADALKVIVTSYRADAEALLEFLVRDSMRAVDALANSASLARQLFAEKFDDPVSAVAGAYYLLRAEAWDRVPLSWFENLSREFSWLPDAAIVHCVRLLREGPMTAASQFTPLGLFAQSVARGWPTYAEGISLLQEAAATLRGTYVRSERASLDRARSLGAAKAWAGAAASFYGRSPDEPSTLQWVGMPRAPRRRRLDPALRTTPTTRGGATVLGVVEAAPATKSPPGAGTAPRVVTMPDGEDFLLGNINR